MNVCGVVVVHQLLKLPNHQAWTRNTFRLSNPEPYRNIFRVRGEQYLMTYLLQDRLVVLEHAHALNRLEPHVAPHSCDSVLGLNQQKHVFQIDLMFLESVHQLDYRLLTMRLLPTNNDNQNLGFQ